MSREDELTYDAQHLAFAGTPLIDRHDRSSLMLETKEIARHPSVYPLVGDVTVVEGTARMASMNATGGGQRVRFAPNVMGRYVPVHELAHVAHQRSGLGGTAHGGEYRAIYADMIGIVYGYHYRDLLWQAFNEMGLCVHPARLPVTPSPVIDIDRLADAGRGVRWL